MSYYEDYWKHNDKWHPSKGGWRDREREMILKIASEGTKLLDYGCGDCERITPRIIAEGINYEGFDISSVAVEEACRKGVSAHLLSDSGGVDRPNETYDAAICLEVLEHLMRPDAAVSEIYRVLKKGGKLLVSVPNPSYFPQRLEFLFTGFLNPGGSPLTSRKAPWKDAHIRFFTISVMKRMLLEAGFKSCSVHGFHFSFHELPWFYKQKALKPVFGVSRKLFGWLGRVWPSLFAPRWYFIAEK